MKMVILSQCPHHMRDDQLVGWGPTLTEISHLAALFDSITHVAALYPGEAPASDLPYTADNIAFIPLPPTGGAGLRAKIGVALSYPRVAGIMLRAMQGADVVHVRGPANPALLSLLLLALWRIPGQRRWIKYAGNWKPTRRESWSYTLQRWLMKSGWHGGQVTVNGKWEGDPPFVHNFVNPCLTDAEWREGSVTARAKDLTDPIRLIYVGRIERVKGVERALRALALLHEQGVPAELDLVGDGPERPALEDLAAALGVGHLAHFHGWVARTALGPLYQQAHLMIFPTDSSEGWPKVISEAMAYGVVPLAGAVSAIPQFLAAFGTGMALPPLEFALYAHAVMAYRDDPMRWRAESIHAVEAAERFTYTRWLDDVRVVLGLPST